MVATFPQLGWAEASRVATFPQLGYFFDEVEMMDSIIIGYIGHEALTLGLSGAGCITSTMSHRNCKNENIP